MPRTILITGASSGIGLACAEIFATFGDRLILCGRNSERLNAIAQRLSCQTQVDTLLFDVRDRRQVVSAFDSLGELKNDIDILINNAGNAHGLDPVDSGDAQDWDAMLDGNVKGLLYVSQQVIPALKSKKKGHIVNISSVAARQTYSGGVVYCASKRAVDVLSEGMRLELTEHGIKVTNIQPGAVKTDFSNVRFKGDTARADAVYQGYEPLLPQDVADAISYCVNAPDHVTISDLTIYPKAQSEPRTLFRNM